MLTIIYILLLINEKLPDKGLVTALTIIVTFTIDMLSLLVAAYYLTTA